MSRTYALQPLLDAVGKTLSAAQHELGIGGPEYRRYRDRGMTRETAERKALRVGLHPYEVWPEMPEHDLADASKTCEAPGCENTWVPNPLGGGRRRFCSNRCWQVVRRQRETPERREERLAKRRAYYEANRQKVLDDRARAYAHPTIAEQKRQYRRDYYRRNRERELERQRRYDQAKAADRRAS